MKKWAEFFAFIVAILGTFSAVGVVLSWVVVLVTLIDAVVFAFILT